MPSDRFPHPMESDMNQPKDIHRVHVLSALAILEAAQAAMDRITPQQQAQIEWRIADKGGKLALFVTNDGETVVVELALIRADERPWENGILRMHGPTASPMANPDTV